MQTDSWQLKIQEILSFPSKRAVCYIWSSFMIFFLVLLIIVTQSVYDQIMICVYLCCGNVVNQWDHNNNVWLWLRWYQPSLRGLMTAKWQSRPRLRLGFFAALISASEMYQSIRAGVILTPGLVTDVVITLEPGPGHCYGTLGTSWRDKSPLLFHLQIM